MPVDKKDKTKNIIYTVVAALLLLAVLFVMLFSYEGEIIRNGVGRGLWGLIILGCIVYAILPIFIPIFKKKPELLFLYYFIIAGLVSLVFIPYGFVPDEQNHYYRVLSLSQLHILSGRADIPANMTSIYMQKGFDNFLSLWKIQASSETTVASCAAAVYYPPLSYLAQTIGAVIAKIFTRNIYVIFIAARTASLAAVTVIIYKAIKIAPFGKYIIIAVSLMPLFVQEAASVSADGITNAIIIADIAYFFYLKGRNKVLSRKQIIVLALLMVATFSVKPLYFLLGFIFLLLDKNQFKGGKKANTMCIIYGISIALPIIYLLLVYFTGFDFTTSTGEGASMMAQLKVLVGNPVAYLVILGKTIATGAVGYFKSCFTLLLLSYPISGKAILIFTIGLLILMVMDYRGSVGPKAVIYVLISSILTVVAIFTMEYLQWTEIGANTIMGVQGRYFFPLLFPLLILIKKPAFLENVNASYRPGKNVSTFMVMAVLAAVSVYELITASVTLLF